MGRVETRVASESYNPSLLMTRMTRPNPLWLALLLLLLSGCATYTSADQGDASSPTPAALQAGHTVGQTFSARHAGLTSVDVFLAPHSPAAGQVTLNLQPLGSGQAVSASLPAAGVAAPGFVRFTFEPQPGSRNQDYQATLALDGPGRILVGNGPGNTYADGALYQDGQPVDAQMAFRLGYDPVRMAAGFAVETAHWLALLAAAAGLYVAPGLALLAYAWPRFAPAGWAERIGIAIGVSLAIYPVLLLWTGLAGLHLGPLYAWAPGIAGVVALAWRFRRWRPSAIPAAWRAWAASGNVWPDVTLVVIAGLVIASRCVVIGSMDTPLWGDSYHHTVITQLIVDHGGLFSSWLPYAEMQTFTYHFGFHADAAVFHWVTGLDTPQAVLWTGQIVNVLAVIALYPLGVRVSGNRWGGVFAVLLAGLLGPMPMTYTNWGRYTQLAGQAILPAVAGLTWSALGSPAPGRRAALKEIALCILAVAGVALTHYRILILAILFFGVCLAPNLRKGRALASLARLALIGVGAGALFLPWFLNVFAGKVLVFLGYQLSTPAQAVWEFTSQYNAAGDLATYAPVLLWLALPIGVGWGLWRRQRGVALVAAWWFLAILVANPRWLNLPGEGAINNFAVLIAAYIPVSLLAGSALSWIASQTRRRWVAPACLLAAVVAGLWGARQRLDDVAPATYALFTRPDARAADWIQKNLPADARLLVNSFPAYGGYVIVGSDGGWWLPLLTGRQTNVPPMNYGNEQEPRPDYLLWVKALPAEIQSQGISHPETLAMLRQRGYTHVYIGQQQGAVGNPGDPTLSVHSLLDSRSFVPVYHQDRVWIFEIRP